VAPMVEVVAPMVVAPMVVAEASVDRMVFWAAGALAAFMDHVEVSVDSTVAVGEVERSVVCLAALEEEAAGAAEACPASTAVSSPVGPVPVQRCPVIPAVTRFSGAAHPPGAAAGAPTGGGPSWQAAWPPTAAGVPTAAAGVPTAAAGVASMAGVAGQVGGRPMAVGVFGLVIRVGVGGPSTRGGDFGLTYGVGPGAAGLAV
jgi:hypothetical protein